MSCGCSAFQSDFACLGCDRPFEEHQTVIENEAERKAGKRPIKSGYMPLAEDPDIQDETMKKLKIGPYK